MVHQLVDGSAPALCRALLLCPLGLSIRAIVHEEGQIMEKASHLKKIVCGWTSNEIGLHVLQVQLIASFISNS